MGTGRSGTTILEILLGNSPKICGVGEAVHIFRDGLQARKMCACGEPPDQCPVWSAVWRDGGWAPGDADVLCETQKAFSWHSRFPQLFLGLISRKSSRFFGQVNTSFINSAARVTSSNVVIDSSKYAGRALALFRYRDGPMKVICITREPAGLIKAFARQTTEGEQLPKTPFKLLAYYVYTMTCLRLASLVLRDECRSITYEQLRSDPNATLQEIGEWSGIDFSESCKILGCNGTLRPGHMVTGNRLRMNSSIRFKKSVSQNAPLHGSARVAELLMRFWRGLLRF